MRFRFAIPLLFAAMLLLFASREPDEVEGHRSRGAIAPSVAAAPRSADPSATLRRIEDADGRWGRGSVQAAPETRAPGSDAQASREAPSERVDGWTAAASGPHDFVGLSTALGLPARPLAADERRKLGPGLQAAYARLASRASRAGSGAQAGGEGGAEVARAPGDGVPPGRGRSIDLGSWSPDAPDDPTRPTFDLPEDPSTPLRVLVTADDDVALRAVGMRIRARVGEIVVGWIRAGELDDLARLPAVRRIERPSRYETQNDAGRIDIRAPQAIVQGGTSGEGALVGVIDSGIDFSHPTFRAADGSTRIEGILDLAFPGDVDADGVLDGPVSGGTVYTRAEIDRALREGNGSAWRWEGVPEVIDSQSYVVAEIWMRDRSQVETLHVHLDIEHPHLADLEITIEDADGNFYEPDALKSATESHAFATYTVPVEPGVSAAGRWYLYVENPTFEAGWLNSWAIFVNRSVHHEDLNGHGTHVAGTAAGSGVGGGSDDPLVGVAPGAELLVVRGERAAAGFYDDDTIVGLQWIDQQADGLGRPFVANMSLGGHGGAHDGSAPLDVAVDALVGPGRPGKAVAAVAGNDGNAFLHAGGELGPADRSIPFWIEAAEDADGVSTTWANIWIDARGTTTPALVHPYGDSFSCFSGTIEEDQLLDAREDCDALTRLRPGSELDVVLFDEDGAVNVVWLAWEEGATADALFVEWYDSESWWVLSGAWELHLPGLTGRWDSWKSGGPACRPLAVCDNAYSIQSPGSARNVITVGAHVTRTQWRDAQGRDQALEERLHDLASFSSRGPTRDGRMKPDLTAPGAAILSARSSDAVPCPYGSWLYCTEPEEATIDWVDPLIAQSSGTSMATPMTSGAIALLLALDPTLDASQIADMLRDGARQDAYTGRPPLASAWGAGKLDLVSAMSALRLPSPGVPPPSTPTPEVGERLVVETAGLRFTAIDDLVFDGPATGRGTAREPIVLPERITGPRPVIRVDGLEDIENRTGYAPDFEDDEEWQLPSVWLRMDVANTTGETCIHYDHELQVDLGFPSADDDGLSFGQGDPWLRPYRSDRFATVIEETEARDFVNFTDGRLADGERGLFELVTSMSFYGEAPGYDGVFLVQSCNRAVPTPEATRAPAPTPLPPSARKHQVYLPISLSGQQCPPKDVFTDIALIIDASTTMLEQDPNGRTKTALSIEAARAFVDGLRLRDRGPSDQVALVAFNATSTVLAPLTPRRAELQAALDDFTPIQMQSRVELGIYSGLAQLVGGRHRRANRQVMVVISDGKANPVPGEEAVQAARGAQEAGIDVLVLGIGPSMDEDVLRRMASRPSDFYRAPSAAALRGILEILASRSIPCDERMYWPYR